MTTSNDLTPEVLEELRHAVMDVGSVPTDLIRRTLPALLAAAQRVQELEAERDLAQLAARLGNETNDELRAKVAELEGDKERLDWWERTLKERADHGPSRTPSYHPGESSTFEDPTPYYIPPGFQMDDDDACHPTFRAAIDAARQAGKEEGT